MDAEALQTILFRATLHERVVACVCMSEFAGDCSGVVLRMNCSHFEELASSQVLWEDTIFFVTAQLVWIFVAQCSNDLLGFQGADDVVDVIDLPFTGWRQVRDCVFWLLCCPSWHKTMARD